MKTRSRNLAIFIFILLISTLSSEELTMEESGRFIQFKVDESNIDYLSNIYPNIDKTGEYKELIKDQTILQLFKEKNIEYHFVGVQFSYQGHKEPKESSRAEVLGSNTSNVDIPDLGANWSNFTMNESGNPIITGISYDLRVYHTWVSDLLLEINNGNRYLTVWNHLGGTTDMGYDDDTADDDDIDFNWRWSTYFNGEPINDTWSLYAEDTIAGDTGFIDWFQINFFYDPPQPDLVVQNELVNGSSSSVTVQPGDLLSTSCTIRNIGDGNADAEWVGYYFENDTPSNFADLDDRVGSDSYPALVPNAYSNETYNYTVPSDIPVGTYYFAFYAIIKKTHLNLMKLIIWNM